RRGRSHGAADIHPAAPAAPRRFSWDRNDLCCQLGRCSRRRPPRRSGNAARPTVWVFWQRRRPPERAEHGCTRRQGGRPTTDLQAGCRRPLAGIALPLAVVAEIPNGACLGTIGSPHLALLSSQPFTTEVR